jgi:hypothetical protein
MKKLLIALLAIMFVAGLFTVAAAEDKLSISGTMRVRAIDAENYSDFNDDNDEDERAYWDQRLRLSGKFKANDAVSAHFRMDFAEDTWGSDNWGGSRYGEGSELQVDRAYLQVVQDLYTLKAGQLFFSTGENYIVYDNNTTGVTLTLKLPVTIDLHYSKLDEDSTQGLTPAGVSEQTDDDAFTTEDSDAYVVQATYKGEGFSVGAFYAAIEDSSDAFLGTRSEDSPNAFGVFGSLALGQLKLQAELDIFGGDYTNAAGSSIDYLGEQFWVNAEYAMESLILGGNLLYAAAQDKDGSEEQISGLNNWGAWQPSTYGPFLEDFMQGPHAGGAEDFNFTGDGAGAVGGTIYAKWNPMEKLILWGSLAYFEAEDDSTRITTTEDITIVNLSAQYEFVPNATIAAMYSTSMISTATGEPDDDASQIAARLQVKF